jgi:hypothetical protein
MDFASLAQENAALKALLARSQSDLAEHQAALAASEEARRRLEIIIDDLRREKFGSKSEKLTPDQFNLPLEDIEIAQGVLDAAQEKAEAFAREFPEGRKGTPLVLRNAAHRSSEPIDVLAKIVFREGQPAIANNVPKVGICFRLADRQGPFDLQA